MKFKTVLVLIYFGLTFPIDAQPKGTECSQREVRKYLPAIKYYKLIMGENDLLGRAKARCGLKFTITTFSDFEDFDRALGIEIDAGNTLTLEEALLLGYQNPNACKQDVYFPYNGRSLLGCRPEGRLPAFHTFGRRAAPGEKTFRLLTLKK
ncbi:MAG: hypothetical protein V4473_00130 [Patescibacteria group bacterium]